MLVSKQFYHVSQNPYLWYLLLENNYKDEYNELKKDTLYDTYKMYHILTKFVTHLKLNYQINKLVKLKELMLHYNQLTTIPPEIGQLSNLQLLHLYSNQLTTIPPEIGQLSNLQILYLSNNQLTTIPQEIGQLSNLHYKDF